MRKYRRKDFIMSKEIISSELHSSKTICIPIDSAEYNEIFQNPQKFREKLDTMIQIFPELFPDNIISGYCLKDYRTSQKLGIKIRRIKTKDNESWSIRPSFVMPYMSGFTSEVEKGLFLRKFNVPFWALAYVFGKDPMYWYRLETSLGRYSIVGTTIKSPDKLPEDVLADEKHTRMKGEKVYIATTVASECILGAEISKSAGTKDLTEAYSVFKEESQNIDPQYKPKSVNIDGWSATIKAWSFLFPAILIVLCFLHSFLSIKTRARKRFAVLFKVVSEKIWNIYYATNKRVFSQRVRRLREWAIKRLDENKFKEKVLGLCQKKKLFLKAYDRLTSHRTSNMLDRLMKFMDRHLFDMQYFHKNLKAAQLGIRAWALIWNFAPSSPVTVKKYSGQLSPAERLNGFRYHDNWLQNLMVSASRSGFR